MKIYMVFINVFTFGVILILRKVISASLNHSIHTYQNYNKNKNQRGKNNYQASLNFELS